MPKAKPETIGDLIDYIAPGATSKLLLAWPPDAFAVAAFVLQKTGAYLKVVKCGEWPPPVKAELHGLTRKVLNDDPSTEHPSWTTTIHTAGRAWRLRTEQRSRTPLWTKLFQMTVQQWVDFAMKCRKQKCATLGENRQLVDAWLQILAASDEAFAGVGFTAGESHRDLTTRAFLRLWETDQHSTLCSRAIKPEVAGVLPKLNTPQTGITLRSLSHYLAFYRTTEVKPRWSPLFLTESAHRLDLPLQASFREEVLQQQSINLLLAPWPEKLQPNQFQPVVPWSLNQQNRDRYGFFEFRHERKSQSCSNLNKRFDALYTAAQNVVSRIDGVVLPELAIEGNGCAKKLAANFLRKNPQGFFVAGVGEPGKGGQPGTNAAVWSQMSLGTHMVSSQAKHHRWQLNRSQIEDFGLGGSLNPSIRWWEYIELYSRELNFMPFSPWFTATVLVCEDLARQEPISELIRTVGPTLVIALLMDGPQLSERWPGRYATSLADDPGSSVLTFTSLGMAELSRPKGKKVDRTVALWKDQETGVTPIELPPGADGLVLSLSHNVVEQWSADGRSDHEGSSYLSLSGIHPIFVKKEQTR